MMADETKEWEIYLYGTVSVVIISLLSLTGAATIPIMKSRGFDLIMTFFVALAVGTMTGDAILHLIPEALGLHSHALPHQLNDSHQLFTAQPLGQGADIDGHSHDDDPDSSETNAAMWKLLVATMTIYGLFLFESLTRLYILRFGGNKVSGHSHAHVHGRQSPKQNGYLTPERIRKSREIPEIRGTNLFDISDDANKMLRLPSESPEVDELLVPYRRKSTMEPPAGSPDRTICGLKSVALMIIMGDSLHNFADGLVIGAAFSTNIVIGIATSIAIFCHELPHELGDFAALLRAGVSVKMALLLNGLSATLALVGLYIGIAVSSLVQGITGWIFAVVAGMFLYVALVGMLGEIKEMEPERSILGFVMVNLGVVLGLIILLMLALYEKALQRALMLSW